MSVAFLIVLFSLFLCASSAVAGQPSTVTVRVVGLTGTTLLPQTQITTTTTPIDPDGEPADLCSGTSAGGALYDATQGNWVVKFDPGIGYEIDGIQGLNFPPFSSKPDAYWSFWLNDAPATMGACEQELEQGTDVVFFAQCEGSGVDCPTSATAPQHFLTETAPGSSSVQVGTPMSVLIGSLSTATGHAKTLPSGVTVSSGSIKATPNAQGFATLTFPSVGTYTIEASAPDSVPSDPHTVCVHNGNDGTCGTGLPPGPCAAAAGAGSCEGPPVSGLPLTVTESVIVDGVKPGHVYSRRHSPRILGGVVKISQGGTIREVRISLQRRHDGRCTVFNGTKATFVRARCGSRRFFSVGDAESFSYLLPSSLPPGRYVYDVEGVNDIGYPTKLVPGVSHVVFYVK
jgi:hypothetical protein